MSPPLDRDLDDQIRRLDCEMKAAAARHDFALAACLRDQANELREKSESHSPKEDDGPRLSHKERRRALRLFHRHLSNFLPSSGVKLHQHRPDIFAKVYRDLLCMAIDDDIDPADAWEVVRSKKAFADLGHDHFRATWAEAQREVERRQAKADEDRRAADAEWAVRMDQITVARTMVQYGHQTPGPFKQSSWFAAACLILRGRSVCGCPSPKYGRQIDLASTKTALADLPGLTAGCDPEEATRRVAEAFAQSAAVEAVILAHQAADQEPLAEELRTAPQFRDAIGLLVPRGLSARTVAAVAGDVSADDKGALSMIWALTAVVHAEHTHAPELQDKRSAAALAASIAETMETIGERLAQKKTADRERMELLAVDPRMRRLDELRQRAAAQPWKELPRKRGCGIRKVGISRKTGKPRRGRTRCKDWFAPCLHCVYTNRLVERVHMFNLLQSHPQLWVGTVPRKLVGNLVKRIREAGIWKDTAGNEVDDADVRLNKAGNPVDAAGNPVERKDYFCRCFAQVGGDFFVVATIKFRLGGRLESGYAEPVDDLTAIERTLAAIDNTPSNRVTDWPGGWPKGQAVAHGSREWAPPESEKGDTVWFGSDPFRSEDALPRLVVEQLRMAWKEISHPFSTGLDKMETFQLPEAACASPEAAVNAVCNILEWAESIEIGLWEPSDATWRKPPPDLFTFEAEQRRARRELLVSEMKLTTDERRDRDRERRRIAAAHRRAAHRARRGSLPVGVPTGVGGRPANSSLWPSIRE